MFNDQVIAATVHVRYSRVTLAGVDGKMSC